MGVQPPVSTPGVLYYRWFSEPPRFTLPLRSGTVHKHRHSMRDTSVPVRQYGSFLPGSGVGGAGEHWNGNSFRFLETQFVLATHLREKFGAVHLPENLAVQDWGVTYNDLEPHYWRGEQMLGVSGKAGNIRGQKLAGGNVFEGP